MSLYKIPVDISKYSWVLSSAVITNEMYGVWYTNHYFMTSLLKNNLIFIYLKPCKNVFLGLTVIDLHVNW